MSYQSPIEVITSAMRISSEQTIAGEVVKAVRKVGINVDKAELLRALAYDRNQYANGYADGRAARDEEIVRCKDCRNKGNKNICPIAYIEDVEQFKALCIDDWYCGSGKPKDGDKQ